MVAPTVKAPQGLLKRALATAIPMPAMVMTKMKITAIAVPKTGLTDFFFGDFRNGFAVADESEQTR